MSSDEVVHHSIERGIATLTLDSPDNRNALSARLVGELGDRLAAAAADEGVRAIVLAHTGSTFCAGADLREAGSEGGPARGTTRMIGLMRSIVELPKPVLAKVEGHVRAGGMGLIGACDIVVAGPGSTFALTEVRLGLAPAMITLTLRGRLTPRALSRYYLTGESFDAVTAQSIGLITSAAADVDAELAHLCEALRKGSPQGLAEGKKLAAAATLAAFDSDAGALQALSQRLFESEQAREGMASFLEKRPAAWVAATQ